MLLPEGTRRGIVDEFIEVFARNTGAVCHFRKGKMPVIESGKILIGLVGHGDRPGTYRIELQAAITEGRVVAISMTDQTYQDLSR